MDALDKPEIPVTSLEKMASVIMKAAGNLLNSISEGSPVSLDDPVYRCDDDVKVSICKDAFPFFKEDSIFFL